VTRDYYFDEAMNVTIDYLQSLSGATGIAEAAQAAQAKPKQEPVPVLQ
jgi:hypothetical protein